MKHMGLLCDIYDKFCLENDLQNISADELIREQITTKQYKFLSKFITIWDKDCKRIE
mgnify:CR=1 FL=1